MPTDASREGGANPAGPRDADVFRRTACGQAAGSIGTTPDTLGNVKYPFPGGYEDEVA